MSSEVIDMMIKELAAIGAQIDQRIEELMKAKTESFEADILTFNKLPWKSSKHGHWVFLDRAPTSIQRALRNRGSLELREYRYELSGDKFIVRKAKE